MVSIILDGEGTGSARLRFEGYANIPKFDSAHTRKMVVRYTVPLASMCSGESEELVDQTQISGRALSEFGGA